MNETLQNLLIKFTHYLFKNSDQIKDKKDVTYFNNYYLLIGFYKLNFFLFKNLSLSSFINRFYKLQKNTK